MRGTVTPSAARELVREQLDQRSVRVARIRQGAIAVVEGEVVFVVGVPRKAYFSLEQDVEHIACPAQPPVRFLEALADCADLSEVERYVFPLTPGEVAVDFVREKRATPAEHGDFG